MKSRELDFEKYSITQQCEFKYWHMDERHVCVIHDFVMQSNVKKVYEIGCYSGFSTIALIEAINQGKDFELHLIEPQPHPSLHELISMCDKEIFLHECTSKEVDIDGDLAIIDGDHGIPGAAQDLLSCLNNNTENIFAHDSNSSNLDYEWSEYCYGAQLIKIVFSNHKDYRSIEDCKERDGEMTHRGLFFSTTSEENFSVASDVFSEHCN